jgi:hypothetical protein
MIRNTAPDEPLDQRHNTKSRKLSPGLWVVEAAGQDANMHYTRATSRHLLAISPLNRSKLLYYFVQIGSHTSPVDYELWLMSRITLASVEHHSGLKTAHTVPKNKKIQFECRNFRGVTQKFGSCQNVE